METTCKSRDRKLVYFFVRKRKRKCMQQIKGQEGRETFVKCKS
jgi:hypothetical protein